ncbi:uncharacterized protein LOC116845244 [Odontomachus brunneus]|uniref:uncharacterized protein LOC116845244 n=1 Tax=Odontomachus brunneus TaxID=486640 RepID=UPI0013F1E2FB|nr:uncharacterized protein LOC116845244 [Odontomachus brunneus]
MRVSLDTQPALGRTTACGQKRPTTTEEQLPYPVYAVRRSLMRCFGQYNFALSRTMCESEILINLVRNCPILYDTKNKDYKDNAKKAETWANIAIKLRLDNGSVAKSKWRHLRDSYAKYLRTQSNTAGQCSKKYKHWAWASQMEFLKPHVTTRQTDYIHTDDYSDSDAETKIKSEPTLEEYVQYYEEPSNERPLVLSLRKRKSQQNLYSNIPDETFEYLQTGKLQKFMDAVDLLFLSHAQTLKTFSPQRQATVKLQIAQIISNAELEQLEELNPLQKFSSPSSPSS